jgi:uncharacterized protein (DUF488 family)
MDRVELLTVGHGAQEAAQLAQLLQVAGVELLVDVRAYPGSRRHPQFGREAVAAWVPAAGIDYRWEPRLGGRRAVQPGSPNAALRNAAFRGYADHMASTEFAAALDEVLTEAAGRRTAVMCAESLWWRCHRRLLADAAVLTRRAEVRHLLPDGRTTPHELTSGARVADDHVVYDAGADRPLPF